MDLGRLVDEMLFLLEEGIVPSSFLQRDLSCPPHTKDMLQDFFWDILFAAARFFQRAAKDGALPVQEGVEIPKYRLAVEVVRMSEGHQVPQEDLLKIIQETIRASRANVPPGTFAKVIFN